SELFGIGNQCRVIDFVPTAVANSMHHHPFDFVTIITAERAKEQLRTELVKPMAAPVVGDGMHEEAASDPHHFHAVLERGRKIEDMLERATVIDQIKSLLQFVADGLIQIVDEGCAFESGYIHREDRARTETKKARLRVQRLFASFKGTGGKTVFF